VRKIVFPLRFALCAIFALSLFGLRAYGQGRDRDSEKNNEHPNGILQDWSRRHVLYPRVGEIHALIAVQRDPRALLSWQAAEREDWHRWRNPRHFGGTPVSETGFHRDWSISLGGGTTAPAMYPAKYGFSPTAVASCPNDFVVFPVNAVGSATQPNIVAFNNLYSGTISHEWHLQSRDAAHR
jgi:hypothetical protein